MKLRRLQQALFLPCTVENDKRQLQAQSQSRSTSKSGISLLGAFLVVLQLMDIMLTPLKDSFSFGSDLPANDFLVHDYF